MTTVGFGDIYPKTTLGKIVGCFCCIFGVVVITLPVPIIANNFNRYFEKKRRMDKIRKEKEIEESLKINLMNASKTEFLNETFYFS